MPTFSSNNSIAIDDGKGITAIDPILGGAASPGSGVGSARSGVVAGFETTSGLNPSAGLYGVRIPFTSAVDFTSKKYLSFELAYYDFGMFDKIDTTANGGMRLLIYDINGNFKRYNIGGSESHSTSQYGGDFGAFVTMGRDNTNQWLIDPSSTADFESGSLDLTNISGLELHLKSTSTTGLSLYIGFIQLIDPTTFTGSGVTHTYISNALKYSAYDYDIGRSVVSAPTEFAGLGGGGFSYSVEPKIGDGVNITNFESDNELITFQTTIPVDSFPTLMRRMIGDTRPIYVEQTSTCTFSISNGTLIGNRNSLDWSLEFSGLGEAIISNTNIVGCNHLVANQLQLRSSTFNGGTYEINTNSIISSSQLITSNLGLYITGGPGDYLDIDANLEAQSGNGITISDSTGVFDLRNISSDDAINIHSEATSGTVTIKLDPSMSATTSSNGSSVVIDNSVDKILTISGIQPNSEVRVYNSVTSDELSGIESTTESTFSSVIPPEITDIDIVIHHLNYEYILLENVQVQNSVSIPISQKIDRTFII